MHQATIDFDDLKSHLMKDETLIDSHYPRSITALMVYLTTNQWSSAENLPAIPIHLRTEDEQINILLENLRDNNAFLHHE